MDHEREVQQLSTKEYRLFEQSYSSCKKREQATFDLTEQEKRVLTGTFADANFAAMGIFKDRQAGLVFEQTRGLGLHLHELLQSFGFMLAMKKCFNGNEFAEKMNVSQLLLIDAAMKGLVLGVTIIPTVRLIRFLSASTFGRIALMSISSVSISGSTERIQEMDWLERMQDNLKSLREELESLRKSESLN
jgi:hypothetical protein